MSRGCLLLALALGFVATVLCRWLYRVTKRRMGMRFPSRGREFRVGTAFPASNDDLGRVVRLLVAVRPLVVTARLVGHVPEKNRTPAEDETIRVLLAQSLGPTHEALEAFRDADRPGVFGEALRLAEQDVQDAYARLRQRRSDQKFRERLRKARNEVVYHVDLEPLQEVLRRVDDASLPVWLGTGGGTTADTAIPLIDLLVRNVLVDRMPDWEAFAHEELWQIQSDLWKLADAAYGYWVAKALGTLKE